MTKTFSVSMIIAAAIFNPFYKSDLNLIKVRQRHTKAPTKFIQKQT